MNILIINCGSSSLKYKILSKDDKSIHGNKFDILASGIVARIGERAKSRFQVENGEYINENISAVDHGEAIRKVLLLIESCEKLSNIEINAIGHRVVHGGDNFTEPTIISKCAKLLKFSSYKGRHSSAPHSKDCF